MRMKVSAFVREILLDVHVEVIARYDENGWFVALKMW